VLTVDVPALADRPDDIPELLAHFAGELAGELARPVRLTAEAIAAAGAHRWPGNVRELRNALTRAAALHDGPIGPRELLPDGPPVAPDDLLAIPRGTYAEMNRSLLQQVVREAGSLRKAAARLAVPRSTLSQWLKPDAA
jgi:DNA-binding NtrC family response regulator